LDDAHFAEEIPVMECGEGDGMRAVSMFDDFDGAFDEDEEGVAFVAFADDPRVGGEVVDEAFVCEEGLRGEADSRKDGGGREGVEELRAGGDHPQKRVTELLRMAVMK
jgi:hypothetical protein